MLLVHKVEETCNKDESYPRAKTKRLLNLINYFYILLQVNLINFNFFYINIKFNFFFLSLSLSENQHLNNLTSFGYVMSREYVNFL